MTGIQTVSLENIADDYAFDMRHERDDDHTAQMRLALVRGTFLPPVSLWQDQHRADGKLALIDGHYRLAAHKAAHGNKPIKAKVIAGTLQEATRMAAEANCKAGRALTKGERMDAAWRLIRLPEPRPTQRTVWEAAGVGRTRVKAMWQHWRAVQVAGVADKMTGRWQRDQHALRPHEGEWTDMTDEERDATKEALAKALRQAAGRWPKRDSAMVAEALELAFGEREMRAFVDYLWGHEAEGDDDDFGPSKGRSVARPGDLTAALLAPEDAPRDDGNPEF
jgi:hypothetical protein